MNHDRELAQTLPARELHELVTSEEYSAIRADLENLPDSDDATIKKERVEILGRLRGLKRTALKKYREQQKENPRTARTSKTEKTDEGHYRTPFYCIRHLMSIRERLSKSMFTIGTIRSQAGRAVLEDLIELYRSKFEVEARLGLELKNCHFEEPKECMFLRFSVKGDLLTLVICEQRPGTHTMEAHLQLPQVLPHAQTLRTFLLGFLRRILLLVPRRQVVHEPRRLEKPLPASPDEPRYSTLSVRSSHLRQDSRRAWALLLVSR